MAKVYNLDHNVPFACAELVDFNDKLVLLPNLENGADPVLYVFVGPSHEAAVDILDRDIVAVIGVGETFNHWGRRFFAFTEVRDGKVVVEIAQE